MALPNSSVSLTIFLPSVAAEIPAIVDIAVPMPISLSPADCAHDPTSWSAVPNL